MASLDNPGISPISTSKLLDDIVTILGSTKAFFWPFLESTGSIITSYKNENHRLTATEGGTDGFNPFKHVGGVHSYLFTTADDQHLLGTDAANASFASAARRISRRSSAVSAASPAR